MTQPANTIASNNTFGLDLYTELAKTANGNTFFSPYSIRTALAMAYTGAAGNTAHQMATVLDLDSLPPNAVAAAFSSLIKSLNPSNDNYELTTANALWGQSGFGFQKQFQRVLQNDYHAPMHEVNFKDSPEPARVAINQWAADQTHDKIKDLLAPRTVDQSTRLILTNAIYFKAAWDEPFKKERTKDEPFHLDAKQQPNVPMMHHSKMSLRYLETDQFQMVELPYKRGELSMVLIVPKAIDGIGAVEKALTSDTLGKMLDAMEYKSVILTIPKFKITAEFGLADTLKAMGMADAFDRKHADFSGMETAEQATTDRLFINQVVHKAFVDVNEDGTEAAAATAVVMVTSAAMQAHVPPPIEVTADRPFLFLIRHHSSATILFMGRLMDPRD